MQRHSRFRIVVAAVLIASGLIELVAFARQIYSVVPEADWRVAREKLASIKKPGDMVVLAPHWTDPIGRLYFDDSLLPLSVTARADDSRFVRAIEVSTRGQHLESLQNWPIESEERAGDVSLFVRRNPSYWPVLEDLLGKVATRSARVSLKRGGEATPCEWSSNPTLAGELGFGPAIPGTRAMCGSAFVGLTILAATDFLPRRCIFAPTPPPNVALAISFPAVHFGRSLVIHHGLHWEAEHAGTGAPVQIRWLVNGRPIGGQIHKDNDGWSQFAVDTRSLEGQTGELEAEITCATPGRQYCFEATTR